MTDLASRQMATFEAGFVQRYHTHPRLARHGQTDGQHQWGVMMLIAMLHPDPSAALLIEAAGHDTGERFAGDLSHPFKRANPDAARAHTETEELFRSTLMAIPVQMLDPEENRWLKLCDRLESLLWVSIIDPQVMFTPPWARAENNLLDAADAVGVWDQVMNLISAAKTRQGCAEVGHGSQQNPNG